MAVLSQNGGGIHYEKENVSIIHGSSHGRSLAGCSSGAKETETTAAASEAGAETAAESEGETAAEDAEEEKTAEGGTLIMGTNATFRHTSTMRETRL